MRNSSYSFLSSTLHRLIVFIGLDRQKCSHWTLLRHFRNIINNPVTSHTDTTFYPPACVSAVLFHPMTMSVNNLFLGHFDLGLWKHWNKLKFQMNLHSVQALFSSPLSRNDQVIFRDLLGRVLCSLSDLGKADVFILGSRGLIFCVWTAEGLHLLNVYTAPHHPQTPILSSWLVQTKQNTLRISHVLTNGRQRNVDWANWGGRNMCSWIFWGSTMT